MDFISRDKIWLLFPESQFCIEKMQLDIEVSPPANILNIIWIPYGHGFILEMLLKYCLGIFKSQIYIFYCPTWLFVLVTFCLIWILVKSRTDRQNTMHMSPPCIRTGGLKNAWHFTVCLQQWHTSYIYIFLHPTSLTMWGVFKKYAVSFHHMSLTWRV